MKTDKDPRHQARRLAVSLIYSSELNKTNDQIQANDENLVTAKEALEINHYDKDLFKLIINGVNSDSEEIKQEIKKHSVDWDIGKIYKIDLSILLISIWQVHNEIAPIKVIIDEAVELAKEFGESDSPKFVNGILAGVVKSKGLSVPEIKTDDI